METLNTNTPENNEMITGLPDFEQPVDTQGDLIEQAATPEMVTGIPEELAPASRREAALGATAINVFHIPIMQESTRFANGKVEVQHPGPTAFNQAAENGTLPDHLTVIR